MWKAMVSTAVILGTASVARAETITDPAQIASKLHFWASETGEPVYYGEVREVSKKTKQVLGHYQCLAIAFIKIEDGVFQYAHKMWDKSKDGSCHYEESPQKKSAIMVLA